MKNIPESFNMFDAKAVKSRICPLCRSTLGENTLSKSIIGKTTYCNNCKLWIKVNYSKTFITLYYNISGINNRSTTKSIPIK